MSRRKQAKPRAVKRELEDGAEGPDVGVTMATDASRELSWASHGSDVAGEGSSIAADDPMLGEIEEVGILENNDLDPKGEGDEEGGEEEEEDIETEEYRCETCNATFSSLTHFMDHRNYDCTNEGDRPWLPRLVSPGASRVSSPASSRTSGSPLVDSPGSPSTAGMGADAVPYNVGVDEAHPYACTVCEKAFQRPSFLKKHELTHPELLPHKCYFCSRTFKHKRSRDRHLRIHAGTNKYKCEHCQFSFARSDHLELHLRTHQVRNAEEEHRCETCELTFPTAQDLATHLTTQHKDKMLVELTCPTCGDGVSSMEELERHMRMHEELAASAVKAVQCPYCREMCAGKDDMAAHFHQYHKGRKFLCPACNAGYAEVEELFSHLRSQHGYQDAESPAWRPSYSKHSALLQALEAPTQFNCPFCDKGAFSSVDVLQIHVHALHADKLVAALAPHRCALCPLAFTTSEQLDHHITSQHGTESKTLSHPCNNCSLEFASPEGLKLHKESAHGSSDSKDRQPVQCTICGFIVEHATALVEHMSTAHSLGGTSSKSNSTTSSRKRSLDLKTPSDGQASPTGSCGSASKRPCTMRSPNSGSPMDSYTCMHCGKTLADVKSYESHMSLHLEQMSGMYACPECELTFLTEEHLEAHLVSHFLAVTTEFGCTSCRKLFLKPDELQRHLMDIHAHHLYRCTLCKEMFDSKVNIQVHFAVKHSNECKLYKCSACAVVFRSEMEWQLHVKVQHLGVSKPYRCLLCRDSFASEAELQHHLDGHKKQFPCRLCPEAFHVEYLLDKHMQTAHSPGTHTVNPVPAISPAQGMSPVAVSIKTEEPEALDFSMRSSPSVADSKLSPGHLSPAAASISPQLTPGSSRPPPPLTKKPELSMNCDICDIKVPDEIALQQHRMQEHRLGSELGLMLANAQHMAALLSKPVLGLTPDKFGQVCMYCNSAYKSKGELEKHMKSHVAPSHQKCQICDEVFPSPTVLAEHKLTHCKVVQGNICVCCKVALKSEDQFYAHSQQHGFTGTAMTCVVCRQTLASLLELQMHGKHHFQNAASFFTCCVCLSTFESKDNLVAKLNSSGRAYYVCKPCYRGDGTPPELSCSSCSEKFMSQSEMEVHMMQHKKTYQCIKCQQSFATEYEIQAHVASHVLQEGNIHRCYLCTTDYDSPAKLQCHLIQHTFEGASELRCSVCHVAFPHASAIQMHVLEHGIGARHYACTHCHQRFFFNAELKNHIFSHGVPATISPATSATDLTKPNKAAGSPNNNMKTVIKTESNQCSLCSDSYGTIAELEQHMLTRHTPATSDAALMAAPKSFPCSECSKEFSSATSLHMHMRVHAAGKENSRNQLKSLKPPKPVPCPICGKTFGTKANVKEHMKIHFVQASIFTCDFCSETFSQAKQLRRHLVFAHKKHQDPDFEDTKDSPNPNDTLTNGKDKHQDEEEAEKGEDLSNQHPLVDNNTANIDGVSGVSNTPEQVSVS